MSSAIYDLFAQAMKERKQAQCTYHERHRVVCPIILGHTGGEEMALVFQVGGKSSKQLRPEGEWRCFHLNEVTNLELHDGPWRTDSSHLSSQHCVEDVDLDINPDSPYSPRRRL